MGESQTDEIRGLIFDIKKFAIHDGPGIRTTVFFKGCPLRCWWCHNPEGQLGRPELMLQRERCNGCGDCLAACGEGALALEEGTVSIDRETCSLCGACAAACPHEALQIVGREATVGEVLEEIERDIPFYDQSGGGVTLSGGEPLMQPDLLAALLRVCHERGLHTTVDTSGFAPPEVLARIADDVDLFLYDLKLINDGRHRRFTGVSNGPILENLRRLSAERRPVVVRVPIVPGINDDDENISGIGEFIASLPLPYPLDLLPYHRAGTDKYPRLGRGYRLPQVRPPAAGRMEEIAAILSSFGLRVTIGGEPYGAEQAGRAAARAEPGG